MYILITTYNSYVWFNCNFADHQLVDRVVATPRGPFVLFVVSVGVANLQLVRQQAHSL